MQPTIGLDISKDRIDAFARPAFARPSGTHRGFDNSIGGRRALAAWIVALGRPLAVFEPTGACHRGLERDLAGAGLAFVKVNPRHARRFAQAQGQLGKSDRADAVSLARMGAALDLAPDRPEPESLRELRALLTARRALVADRVAGRTRAQTAELPLIRQQIARRLRQILGQIAALDAEIARRIDADPALARRRAILQSIPGIARITAASLLIDMPELGRIGPAQAASLAGLAPVERQSGRWTGSAHIAGGRAPLRRSLYMPALSAARANPDLARVSDRLKARGKPAKLILTAIMRKLVVLANALLKADRTWTPITT
jgi:transposase